MKEHHLDIVFKTSYHTLNDLTADTERVWIVFHGYGQLSEFFIKHFKVLDPDRNFIIAPQGLSKFYLQGVNGRVGATWMTKNDRLVAIENQFSYLDEMMKRYNLEGKKLIYFGFSQGAATMGRYASHAKIPFHEMVLWAGTFPPDTNYEDWNYLSGKEKISYWLCEDDPYFRPEMIPSQKELIASLFNKKPRIHWYEGGHRVINEIISELELY